MQMVDCRLSIFDRVWCGIAGRSAAMLCLGLALCLIKGCGRQTQNEKGPKGPPLTKSAKDGPVSLTLTVQPAELAFSERAVLTVEALAEKSATVQLADYADAVAEGDHQFEYRLRRLAQASAVPTESGVLRWSQKYEIEFFLPGEYELPPARLTFSEPESPDARGEKTTEIAAAITPKELATETVKIVAKPTEATEIPPEELTKIEVLPPVELKDPWSRWWYAAIPGAAVVALLAWMALRRRRMESIKEVEVIPAHEWARRQIASLVAEDLITRGQVQEFYYRISAIVRGYIERRYAVNAPEMTTEEFLSATAGDFRFATGPAGVLQDFMTACDLVKYARQRPAAGEWNDLLRTAVQFVEQTREQPQDGAETARAPAGASA